MNEEVNYCDQCGSKINSDAKFCSSCGHDLKNSSTKITSDKTIKVEVTNAKVEVTNVTVEKGFKAIEKGVKATGKGLKEVFKKKEKAFKIKEKTWKSDLETPPQKRLERQPPQPAHSGMTITEIIKSLVFYVLIPLAVLIGIPLLLAFLGSISGNN